MTPSRPPDEPRSSTSAFRKLGSTVEDDRKLSSAVRANLARIRTLTERQFGLATWAQMRRRGVPEATISRWVGSERLYLIHFDVYSIVPPPLMTIEAWHAAAILAGGEGACLCCESAAWWASLIETRPPKIHVVTRWDVPEPETAVFHRISLREGERVLHRGLPITAPVRIPLDVASGLSPWELKRVLAELEFHHDVRPDQVRETLRRGYPGSAKLRRALEEHTPELALTASELEAMFIRFLSDRGFILPSFNANLGKATVDATYEQLGIVFELDGTRGHSGERRILRDHRRDLHRRADGLSVIRYHYTQLVDPTDQRLVEAELVRLGIPREPCW